MSQNVMVWRLVLKHLFKDGSLEVNFDVYSPEYDLQLNYFNSATLHTEL